MIFTVAGFPVELPMASFLANESEDARMEFIASFGELSREEGEFVSFETPLKLIPVVFDVSEIPPDTVKLMARRGFLAEGKIHTNVNDALTCGVPYGSIPYLPASVCYGYISMLANLSCDAVNLLSWFPGLSVSEPFPGKRRRDGTFATIGGWHADPMGWGALKRLEKRVKGKLSKEIAKIGLTAGRIHAETGR